LCFCGVLHGDVKQIPTTRETLENLDLVSQVTQQPIEKVSIFVPTTGNFSHYQKLVTALSNKYKVNIAVWTKTQEGKPVKWLSKTPQDSDVAFVYPVPCTCA
jgi:RecA-family ATPase